MLGPLSDREVLRLAVDASPNGILVCDRLGTIVFANHQIEATFGYDAAELVGRPVDQLLSVEDRGAWPWEGERHLRGRRKDGSLVRVEARLSATSEGSDQTLVASVIDLTHRESGGEMREASPEAPSAHVDLERMLSRLAVRFVNVPPTDVDAAIADSQRQIVEAFDLDHSALWTFDADDHATSTHLWRRVDGSPDTASALPASLLRRVRAGETVAIDRADRVADPVERASLERAGIKSMVLLPFGWGADGTGSLLSFASVRRHRPWPRELLERLQMVALVFEQALARRRAQESLTKSLGEVKDLRDRLTLENSQLKSEVRALRAPRRVVAESAAVRRVLADIEPVAASSATVLLLGETGSGKDLFAQTIHELSDRHHRPMVRVNCGAIPPTLLESELFGHERGAYTGALAKQIGRFELADGSTLFLDEVGELPLDAQVKLLRVLQDKVIERLGSVQSIKVNVRIIAATNRDLEHAVQTRAFREDLYYRLNVYPITVPPLRDRREDIPVLAWAFVDEFSKAFGKRIDSISRESLKTLLDYHWPGNVRELRNTIERAVIVATSRQLVIEPPRTAPAARLLTTNLMEMEAQHIREVLDTTGWRVRGTDGAAERLGMKPTTLESRMAKLGIRRPRL